MFDAGENTVTITASYDEIVAGVAKGAQDARENCDDEQALWYISASGWGSRHVKREAAWFRPVMVSLMKRVSILHLPNRASPGSIDPVLPHPGSTRGAAVFMTHDVATTVESLLHLRTSNYVQVSGSAADNELPGYRRARPSRFQYTVRSHGQASKKHATSTLTP